MEPLRTFPDPALWGNHIARTKDHPIGDFFEVVIPVYQGLHKSDNVTIRFRTRVETTFERVKESILGLLHYTPPPNPKNQPDRKIPT